MGRIALAVLLAGPLALCGCGETGDGTGPADAGAGDAAPPLPGPAIPWLAQGVPPVVLTPCPEGWREVRDATGIPTCEPYPATGPSECAFGEAHFPGEAGCRPIGAPCPAGDFADGLPTDGSVVFVRPGATGGDGSRAAPFGDLAEVPWRLRGAGWTVALSKGSHTGTLPLTAGVVVVGACVAETRVTGLAPVTSTIGVTSRGEPAVVRNLAVVDAPQAAVIVASGRALTLEGILVARANRIGVQVVQPGTVLRATDLVVDETSGPPTEVAAAVVVASEGHLEASRMLVRGTVGVGLAAQDLGTVALSDAAILGSVRGGSVGRGVNLVDAGALTATRALVAHNEDEAFYASGAGTRLTLADVVITDHGGIAIDADTGAAFEGQRLFVSATRATALLFGRPGASASLSDVLVVGTAGGRALSVQEGGTLRAERAVLARNAGIGMIFSSAESDVTLVDVAVRDPAPIAPVARGFGIQAQAGCPVTADRVLVDGTPQFGVLAVTGGRFTGRDVFVANVPQGAAGDYGHAVAAVGGTVELSGFVASAAGRCGVLAALMGGDALPDLDLHAGVVERAAIGACLQVDGFDLARLTTGVVYRDNERNLETTSLPVPDETPLDLLPR